MKLVHARRYKSNLKTQLLENGAGIFLTAAYTFLAVFLYTAAIAVLVLWINQPATYLPILTIFLKGGLPSFCLFFGSLCLSALCDTYAIREHFKA
jgi:fatty acid desaturase